MHPENLDDSCLISSSTIAFLHFAPAAHTLRSREVATITQRVLSSPVYKEGNSRKIKFSIKILEISENRSWKIFRHADPTFNNHTEGYIRRVRLVRRGFYDTRNFRTLPELTIYALQLIALRRSKFKAAFGKFFLVTPAVGVLLLQRVNRWSAVGYSSRFWWQIQITCEHWDGYK